MLKSAKPFGSLHQYFVPQTHQAKVDDDLTESLARKVREVQTGRDTTVQVGFLKPAIHHGCTSLPGKTHEGNDRLFRNCADRLDAIRRALPNETRLDKSSRTS
jgi:hypothetical protein